MPKALDGVELRVASGRWPAGTVGTIVEASDDGVLVEISDEEGREVDSLDLPWDAVAALPKHRQERLAGV